MIGNKRVCADMHRLAHTAAAGTDDVAPPHALGQSMNAYGQLCLYFSSRLGQGV